MSPILTDRHPAASPFPDGSSRSGSPSQHFDHKYGDGRGRDAGYARRLAYRARTHRAELVDRFVREAGNPGEFDAGGDLQIVVTAPLLRKGLLVLQIPRVPDVVERDDDLAGFYRAAGRPLRQLKQLVRFEIGAAGQVVQALSG